MNETFEGKDRKTVTFGILFILGNRLKQVKTKTRLFLSSLTYADLADGLFVIFPLFVICAFESVLQKKTERDVCFAIGK